MWVLIECFAITLFSQEIRVHDVQKSHIRKTLLIS
jgi:hypothetical protein